MIYPTGTITIEELQSIKLPVVNFAEGYKVAEVDVFLGKCADTLRNGYGLSAEEVERHSFTSTYMGGYAIGDVDLLLDRIAWTLKTGHLAYTLVPRHSRARNRCRASIRPLRNRHLPCLRNPKPSRHRSVQCLNIQSSSQRH